MVTGVVTVVGDATDDSDRGGVSAIEAMHVRSGSGTRKVPVPTVPVTAALLVLVATFILFALSAASAFAIGQASSGELVFYPCTTCHPVTEAGPAAPLPNDFEGHQIVLQGHDQLGEGSAACVVCHDDPARDPGKLKAIGGGFVEVGGDVSGVCRTCHSGIYNEWVNGIHGREQPTCTSAGCHDPHTPSWIYGEPLPPFVATGFEVRAVSDRIPFTPLAAYPMPAPVYTPLWLWLATGVVAVAAVGLVIFMLRGRPAR